MTIDKVLKEKKPKHIKLLDVAKALNLSKQGLFYHINNGKKGINSLSAEQMRIVAELLGVNLSIFFD